MPQLEGIRYGSDMLGKNIWVDLGSSAIIAHERLKYNSPIYRGFAILDGSIVYTPD